MAVHHVIPLHTLPPETIQTIYPWKNPRKIKHGDSGCWHHLDGLVTLCGDCHHEAHHPAVRAEQLPLESEAA